MLDLSTLWIFVLAAFALIVTPGPSVLYIVARSIEQGRLAGVVSALGIATGTMVHIAAAAFGISAILMTSATAFTIVKLLGAAYLIYLGIRTLMQKDHAVEVEVEEQKLSRIFTQGMIVNVLNPKTALFFFAFLPQFVDPVRGSAAVQIFMLGMIFNVIAISSDSIYAIIAGTIRVWLKQSKSFWRRQRYFSGSVYILLGLGTAFTGNNK